MHDPNDPIQGANGPGRSDLPPKKMYPVPGMPGGNLPPEEGEKLDARQEALLGQLAALEARGRNGAGWFYWVAGLSLINSAIALFGGTWGFVIGLGVTQVVDVVAQELAKENPDMGTVVKIVALAFDLVVAGIVIAFGWLASRRYLVVYALGMVLYLLDGLLYLLLQDFLAAGFHAFVLFWMWNGFSAYRQLNALERELRLASEGQGEEYPADQV